MSDARWERLQQAFDEAAERAGAARAAYLDALRAEDAALAAEVEELLAADAAAAAEGAGGRGLERPRFDAAEELGAADDTPPGTRIGGWVVERALARGGMGEVLLARRTDKDFEQRAAVKLLREALRYGSFEQRFARERRTLAGLDHPHIAPLLDGGETEGGIPWLATRFVEGLPLDRHADERGLGIDARVRLMLPVCAAVHYAHQRLVVHRDLKPANVMVTPDGEPVLLDFGIAKLLDAEGGAAEEALTRGVQVMTPEYASPEQVRGEAVSTATDVYSLGVVLYRLLCGALPQDGATGAWEQSRAVAEGALTSARARNPAVPRDLDAVLQRALALDPAARYPSAQALADDLERYLKRLPVEARVPTAWYRMRRFVARNRWSTGFAAAALLALVGGTVGVLQQQRVALREARTTERVSAFLVDLFDARDPWNEGLSAITLEDVFDRGIERARGGLEEEPEVRSELLAVLATVLRNLGEEERAAELFEEALALDPGLARRAPARQAERLFEAGVALHRAQRWEEARPVLEECLRLRLREAGERDAGVASARNTLGLVLWRLGAREEALAELERALELRRALLAPDDPDVAVTQGNLAAVALADGDVDEAVRRFREAVATLVAAYPDGHPDRATAHNNLGMALHAADQDAEAEQQLRAGLAMRARLFPEGHPHLASSHNNLGLLYYDQGRLEEARAEFAAALEMARAKASADHPLVRAFAGNLQAVEDELAAAQQG